MSIVPLIHHSGWPWPLDIVQNWFEGLWDSINAWAYDAAKTVWSWMPEPLRNFVTALGQFTLVAINSFFKFLADPVGTLKGAFDSVWLMLTQAVGWWDPLTGRFVGGISGWLWDALGSVGSAVGAFGGWLWDQIQSGLGWLKDVVWGWVEGSLRWLTDSFHWLGNQVSETGAWIRDGVVRAFDGAVASLSQGFANILEGIGSALGESLRGALEWVLNGLNGIMTTLVSGIVWLGTQLQAAFNAVGAFLMGPISNALKPGSPPAELEGFANAYVKNLQDRIMSEVSKVAKSPADPERAIAAGYGILAAMTTASVVGQTLGMAFDATHPAKGWGAREMVSHISFELLDSAFGSPILQLPVAIGVLKPMEMAYNKMFRSTLVQEQFLRVMLWRGVIKPEEYQENLAYQGFPDWAIKGFLDMTQMIPGAGDLITFVVREVIDVGTFTGAMAKQGYSEFWAKAYWGAHWVLPSTGVLIDSYHRGGLKAEELDKFLTWHDFSPEPRPGISKSDLEIYRGTLKRLIPRVDLRYAWEFGSLSRDDLVERYRAEGFEDDAELMAEIQMMRAMTEELTKIRGEWIQDYVDGYTDQATLESNLAALGISPERIDYYRIYAQKRRDREYMKDLLDSYEDSYVKDLITDEELESHVRAIIEDDSMADLFLRRAYVRKYKKPKEVKAPEAPKLSLAMLRMAFREGVITETDIRSELAARGYSGDDIELMITLDKEKMA